LIFSASKKGRIKNQRVQKNKKNCKHIVKTKNPAKGMTGTKQKTNTMNNTKFLKMGEKAPVFTGEK